MYSHVQFGATTKICASPIKPCRSSRAWGSACPPGIAATVSCIRRGEGRIGVLVCVRWATAGLIWVLLCGSMHPCERESVGVTAACYTAKTRSQCIVHTKGRGMFWHFGVCARATAGLSWVRIRSSIHPCEREYVCVTGAH